MISLKTSLAFVITIMLAIVAYLISFFGLASTIQHFIPSLFVLLTTCSFLVITNVQGNSNFSQVSEKTDSLPKASGSGQTSGSRVATLYVGNLAYKANEQNVQDYFSKIGVVKSVRLVKDKRTGRRKGFGFVEVNQGDEQKFIKKLNENEFMERNIIVRPANEKQH